MLLREEGLQDNDYDIEDTTMKPFLHITPVGVSLLRLLGVSFGHDGLASCLFVFVLSLL